MIKTEKKFNLIDEKWIRVRDNSCNVTEVSLKEALLNAHEYTALAGELPTQDIAVLRVMLAVLHTVFSRVDIQGVPITLSDKDDAFDQWRSVWENGKIPEKPICDYFDKWHDRFWLVHPERPFWQVAELKTKNPCTTARLNGELSESAHTIRLFSKFSREEKTTMSFSQAARWLINLNNFDDTAAKNPTPKSTWLSELGLTLIKGKNLFETLLFNMVMINGNSEAEVHETPIWEQDKIAVEPNRQISIPDNAAQLYTIQFRRICLIVENDKVVNYYLTGGDYFDFQNEPCFIENMTLWKIKDGSYKPLKYSLDRQQWREFGCFLPEDTNSRTSPIVVSWFQNYVCRVLPKKTVISVFAASTKNKFDASKALVDIYSDSLSMSVDILAEKGKAWRNRINEEIEKCNEVAKKVHSFAVNVHIANGGDTEDTEVGSNAKVQFFYKLDIPFREWLVSIDPEEDDVTDKLNEWKKTVYRIVYELADEISANATPQAYVGVSRNGKVYSVPYAQNTLFSNLKNIYDK